MNVQVCTRCAQGLYSDDMSTVIERTVTTRTPPDVALAYLADFTHTNDWDPGTVETRLAAGDGGVGTRYENTSRFLGRTVHLTYVVTTLDEHTVRLRAANRTTRAEDTMTVRPTPEGGTRVDYRAEFWFHGPARFFAPLLGPAFTRLGDRAQAGLQRELDRLAH